jgi:dTDP-4-amino-4,6-dideoxygalactose transaminase
MSSLSFIPYHRPMIGKDEIREVTATLRSGWLTTGPRTGRFQQEFKAYTGSKYAQAVNSCTAALHLALVALGIGSGDEVITTPTTFCSTVNTILHVGATPVLADIGGDGNIDPVCIAGRITPKTRAIIPVHLAGHPCDMDEIWSLARKHKLFVLEDAAHAIGTFYRGFHLGSANSASDAVAYSFYATKNITTGEGGMLTTNNEALAARVQRLTLHGISKDAWNRYSENGSWYYEVAEPGFKYNLTDIQSAIGIHQLRKIEGFIATRTELAQLYRKELAEVEELETPADCPYGRHSWHLYLLGLRPDLTTISRDRFILELQRRQIGASVHFIPIPLHPFFVSLAGKPENHCPNALKRYTRTVSLPLYPGLTESQVRRITASIKDIVRMAGRRVIVAVGTATA